MLNHLGAFVALLLATGVRGHASSLECTPVDADTRLRPGGFIMGHSAVSASEDPHRSTTNVSIELDGSRGGVTVTASSSVEFAVRAFGVGASLNAAAVPWNTTEPYVTASDDGTPAGSCAGQLYLEMGPASARTTGPALRTLRTYRFNQTNATKLVLGYAMGADWGFYLVTAEVPR